MLLTLVVLWLLFSPVLSVLIGRLLRKQSQYLYEAQLHLKPLTPRPLNEPGQA